MEPGKLTALLIGENLRGSSFPISLKKRGWERVFAMSCHEAFMVLSNTHFDFALSVRQSSELRVPELVKREAAT